MADSARQNDGKRLLIKILVLILAPVSYTHLDVYKRQMPARAKSNAWTCCCSGKREGSSWQARHQYSNCALSNLSLIHIFVLRNNLPRRSDYPLTAT